MHTDKCILRYVGRAAEAISCKWLKGISKFRRKLSTKIRGIRPKLSVGFQAGFLEQFSEIGETFLALGGRCYRAVAVDHDVSRKDTDLVRPRHIISVVRTTGKLCGCSLKYF